MSLARRAIRAVAVASLVLGACGCASAAASVDSGISGRVVLGPTCPVQRIGQTCERAYQTTVAIYAARGGRLVHTFRSGADGRFRVRLAPGRYSLRGAGAGLPN